MSPVATPPPARPAPRTIAEQVCRFWIGRSALTVSLVMDDPVTMPADAEEALLASATVFPYGMPDKRYRGDPAASVVAGASTTPDETSGTQTFILDCEARASEGAAGGSATAARRAEDLLTDLVRCVRPGGLPLAYPGDSFTGTAKHAAQLIGPPYGAAFFGASLPLWRVLRIVVVAEPQITAFFAGAGGAESGETAARCTLAAHAVAAEIPAPTLAFTLTNTQAPDPAQAGVVSVGGFPGLAVTDNAGSAAYLFASGATDTIGELKTVAGARAGWSVSDEAAGIDDRASADLFPLPLRAATDGVGFYLFE